MLIAMFAAFIINVLLGVPLFLSLLVTAIIGFVIIDPVLLPRMLPQQMFGGIDVFSLMAICARRSFTRWFRPC